MKNISEIEAYEEVYPQQLYINYWVDCWDSCYYGFSASDEKSYPENDDVIYVRSDIVQPWHKYPKEKPSNDGAYLCTVVDDRNDDEKRHVEYISFNTEKNCWFDLNGDVRNHIDAWQELPRPYLY
jgi:hypothetical protein